MLAIYRVAGDSMFPKVRSGDYVVLWTATRFITLTSGMLVIFHHPQYGLLLKQVVCVEQKRKVFSAQGLNLLSIDTYQLGTQPFFSLRGVVLWKIYRPSSRKVKT